MRRNNLNISFKDFITISEGKKVGTLYHFTRLSSLLNMLPNFDLKSYQEYISFTRNYNLIHPKHNNSFSLDYEIGDKRNVRIVIDGDKLSNKYKIKPYIDLENGITRHHQEQEEIINSNSANSANSVSIRGCIKEITIIQKDNNIREKILNRIQKLNKDNIKIVFVDSIRDIKRFK